MSHPMLSYIEELDVLEGLNRTVSTLVIMPHTTRENHKFMYLALTNKPARITSGGWTRDCQQNAGRSDGAGRLRMHAQTFCGITSQ